MNKTLLTLILLCFSTIASADIIWLRTTAFASANVYRGTYYWSDWERSDMRICINTNTDIITIYSPKTQYYGVTAHTKSYVDNQGAKVICFSVIDQDGDRGQVRLRACAAGNSQLYVDFTNVAWVYNVYRTN
jgi:hypothetical protein